MNIFVKILVAVAFLLSAILTNHSASAENSVDDNAQCIKGSVNKTELTIQEQMANLTKFLGQKASKAIEPVTNNENFEFVSKTGKVLGKELGRFGYSTKITFYKYIRKHGIKLKLKIPIDFNLSQKLLDKLLEKVNLNASVKFTATYEVDIDPDLRTGHIYRSDSIIFKPELSYSELLGNFTGTGTLGTIYTYTLTRKHLGHKKDQEFKNLDEFIKPIRTVLKARPVFFKERCNQSQLGYIGNIKSNLDIPSSYDHLNEFMMIDDTLTLQKKLLLVPGAGIGKVTNALNMGFSISGGRVVSLNKVVHKTQQRDNPYPIYHIKTFLDSVDTTFSPNAEAKTGAFQTTLVSWKQLNKAILKPLVSKVLNLFAGRKKQLTFLNSFFLSLEDPRFKQTPELIQNIKGTYDHFFESYFIPKWDNIKSTNSLLVSLDRGDTKKEHLKNLLIEIIQPLQDAYTEAKDVIDRLNIPTDQITDPTCNGLKLYPITNYFSGTRDLQESFLNFNVALPLVTSFKYSQKGKDNFYKFKDKNGANKYYSQAVLNLQSKSHFLFTKQEKYRQTYLLADAGSNKSILNFKTLGFNYELSDTNFYRWNKLNFRTELKKIIPVGRLKKNIEKELKFIEPYIKNSSAYLGYKYLFTQAGFKLIQDRVTNEAKRGNFNYIYNLLNGKDPNGNKIGCMNRNDANYENKIACISHLPQFNDYIRFKRNGGGYFDETKVAPGRSIHYYPPKVDEALKSIAIKLTLILLDFNDKDYYRAVNQMSKKVKRMFYKSKFFKLTNKKRFATVNNAKYAIFKSLSGVKLFDFTIRTVQGEETIFRDIAPVFLTYMLYYSMDSSNHEAMYMDSTYINKYLYFYALFRSPEDNIERPVRMTYWSTTENKEKFEKMDESTKQIIQKINFFEFHFDNVHNNRLMCDKDDSAEDERVRFVN